MDKLKELVEDMIDEHSLGELLEALRLVCITKASAIEEEDEDTAVYYSNLAIELEATTKKLLRRGL